MAGLVFALHLRDSVNIAYITRDHTSTAQRGTSLSQVDHGWQPRRRIRDRAPGANVDVGNGPVHVAVGSMPR